MGTFAYLVSTEGARRLLEEEVIFPLDFQLDVQLNHAYATGRVCAYRCLDDACLFFSAPRQFVDSDVQACWSADHDPTFHALKKGFARRIEELDHEACPLSAAFALLPDDRPPVAVADARLCAPRLCIAVPFVTPDEAGARAAALAELHAALAAVRHCATAAAAATPVVLVWYGHDRAAAEAAVTAARAVQPALGLLWQGPLAAALEAEWPGCADRGQDVALLAHILTLKAVLPLCVEDVLIADATALSDVRVLSRLLVSDADLVALAPAVGTDACEEEPQLGAIFREFYDASFVLGREAPAAPAPRMNLHAIVYRGRAWARVATWIRELLRLFMRLGVATGSSPGAALPLTSARGLAAALPMQHAELAFRCVLALAGLSFGVVAPPPPLPRPTPDAPAPSLRWRQTLRERAWAAHLSTAGRKKGSAST
eukprot:NODE_7253_length_1595_cov_10.910763.p1 GENE.NODE_7253_length_1595_cov_10.910763~~NODE_7253_length_1595_cov_10.910763.p1  ORF type:complete len:453 (+),score=129.70 NODE_7253_length_1595_cov_10.910763:73-1359(+)